MNLDDVFLQIANEMKISVDEVKKQIVACVSQCGNSNDINIRHFLSSFTENGEYAAEDVVLHIVGMVMKKLHK